MNTKKKVLVTGATGFLGYHVIKYLVEKNFCVVGIGRKEKNKVVELGAEFFKVDLTVYDELEKKLSKDFDYIVHCAGFSSPWGKKEEFEKGNIVCTQNIIKFASRNIELKKIIHISTSSIYFEYKDRYGIKEEERAEKFVNEYARTKYEAEKLLEKSGLDYIILRPRGIYGEEDETIFPRLIRVNESFGIPLSKVTMSLTYAGNVAYGVYLAINSSRKNTIYNITDNSDIKFDELLNKVFSKLGKNLRLKKRNIGRLRKLAKILEFFSKYFFMNKEPILTEYSIGIIAYNQVLDISKIKKELGYSPIFSVEDGIERFVKWYREERKE